MTFIGSPPFKMPERQSDRAAQNVFQPLETGIAEHRFGSKQVAACDIGIFMEEAL
jgi:hypothetical protein